MDIFVCGNVAIEDKVLLQSWLALVIMLKRFFILYLCIFIYIFLNPCKSPLETLETNSMNTYSVFITGTNV